MQARKGKDGSYKPSFVRKALRRTGKWAGGLYGAAGLGKAAGNGIADLIGAGAYRIGRPGGRTRRPARGNFRRAALVVPKTAPLDMVVTVSKREYIRDVSTATDFSAIHLPVNPGMKATFPWLSTLAPCFQKYKFRALAFDFVSTSATAVASTNTALGTVGAVVMVDPADSNLESKMQAENYTGCRSAVPSRSFITCLECDRKDAPYRWYWVRSGAPTTERPLVSTDEGKFCFFSQGAQAASTAGELWVTYTVDLIMASLPDGGIVAYTDEIYGTSADTTNPLGTTATYNDNNNIGITTSPTAITFPAEAPEGLYMVLIQASYASSQTMPTFTLTMAGSIVDATNNIFKDQLVDVISSPASGATATSRMLVQAVRKTSAATGTVTVAITHPAVVTTVELVITLLNPNLSDVEEFSHLRNDDVREIKEFLREKRQKAISHSDVRSFIREDDDEIFDFQPRKRARLA